MVDNLNPQNPGSQQGPETDINMSVFDIQEGQGQQAQVQLNMGSQSISNQNFEGRNEEDFDFFEDAGMQNSNPQTNQQNTQINQEQFEQLPEEQKEVFYQKDPELRARSFQSRYDKSQAELAQIKVQSEQYRKAYELLNEAASDEEIRQALISELNPEGNTQFDIDGYVAKKISKEFGEDFEFDPQLAHVPGPHFRYAERMRNLYTTAQQEGVGKVRTIKEIKEQRKLEQQKQELYMQQQVESIRNSHPGVTDEDIRATVQFAEKLSVADFYKIRRFMSRQTGAKQVPYAAGIAGGTAPQSGPSAQLKQWLDSF